MHTRLKSITLVVAIAGALSLSAGQAQAAVGCQTSKLGGAGALNSATVVICREASGTVTSVSGSVTDQKPGDHKCARLDVVQVYGDLDEGEYVATTDVACGGTTSFEHVGRWVDAPVQLNLFWVAGGSEG